MKPTKAEWRDFYIKEMLAFIARYDDDPRYQAACIRQFRRNAKNPSYMQDAYAEVVRRVGTKWGIV